MQAVWNHIERVKEKPHHLRKRIAFLWAAGISGIIGLVWLAASVSSGAFAIRGASFADSIAEAPVVTVPQSSALAGAAAALPDASLPAHIDIVNTAPVTVPKTEQTTLPF